MPRKYERTIEGKKVRDAKRALTVEVTQGDCKTGARKNARACAAAIALVRVGECTRARVNVARTYLEKDDHWVRYETPMALRSEVIAFDRGGVFDPGVYKLNPIRPSQAPDKRSEARKRNETVRASHDGKGLRKSHMPAGIRRSMHGRMTGNA